MLDLSTLPTVNAALNATSALLLVTAHSFIKRGRITAHKRTMLAAVVSSALFLVSYLYYHAHIGSRHFAGPQPWRGIYLTILLTHTILAAVIVPLVLVTLTRGLKGRFDRHRPIARITYPLWLYVSVTGVVIYVMLYRIRFA